MYNNEIVMENNLPKKHAGGRPKKYTNDFIENEAIALLEYAKTSPIPFFKDFCPSRGYSTTTAFNCGFFHNEKFLDAYNIFKNIAEAKIFTGAITNKLNSFMAFAYLKNVAGWRDKLDVEHSGDLQINYGHREKQPNRVEGHIDSSLRN